MDFSIRSEYGIIFTIAAILAAAIAAYFYYKGSSAPGKLRWVLASLRFLSLLFIILLFMSPVLSFIGKNSKKPVSILLIDNSKSVLAGNREKFQEQVLSAVKNSGQGTDTRIFLFSDGITYEITAEELPAISPDSTGSNITNLTKALRDLKSNLPGENISSVTVISDGILNDGGNPVQNGLAIGAPVNFYLAGDTSAGKDISVAKIFYNKTAFIESSVPVSAEIKVYGHTGNVTARLFEDGRLADTKELVPGNDGGIRNVDFTVSSPDQKTVLYRIEVDSIDGEFTVLNNFREFFIKFVDNKFKLLILSGAPSADLAFLKEKVKQIKNFEADFRTQKGRGEYYEGPLPKINEYDALLMFGFPTSASDDAVLEEINTAVEKTNLPVIFFASANIDYAKIRIIEGKLPFVFSSGPRGEEETSLSVVSGTASDFFRGTKIISDINGLPNIFTSGPLVNAKPGSQTSIVAGRSGVPVLIISKTTDKNSAAFLAYGIYKWRLGEDAAKAGEVLSYLLANLVSSVASKDEGRKFTVETTSPVYSKNEGVAFNASITGFEIRGGEQVNISINGPSYQGSFEMKKTSARSFQLVEKMPAEGVYNYEAALISEGRKIEKVTGKFLVGENNFEYLETRPDPMLLNELASATGGSRLNGLSESEVKKIYEESGIRSANEISVSKSFSLNINPYYLGIIIFLLSVEWFLRKRNNLP